MHPLQNGSQVTERPADKPVSGLPGYFTESGENNVPSYPGADWFNNVIDEFLNVLSFEGITFDPSRNDHLSRAFEFIGNRAGVYNQEFIQYNIDQNGKDWFIEDGFLVFSDSGLFRIKSGVGYVTGNRAVLDVDTLINVPDKPSFVYVDAYRQATDEGALALFFDFDVTDEEKTDYTDVNGVRHFVAKIAHITVDGNVIDHRSFSSLTSLRNQINEMFYSRGGYDFTNMLNDYTKFAPAMLSRTSESKVVICGGSVSFNGFDYPPEWFVDGGGYATDNPFGLSSWSYLLRDFWFTAHPCFKAIESLSVSSTAALTSGQGAIDFGINNKKVGFDFYSTDQSVVISTTSDIEQYLIISYASSSFGSVTCDFEVNGVQYNNQSPTDDYRGRGYMLVPCGNGDITITNVVPSEGAVGRLYIYGITGSNSTVPVITGKGGYGTTQILSEYDDLIGKYTPDFLIMMVGGNDSANGTTISEFKDNLRNIINRTRSLNPGVVIVMAGCTPHKSIARDVSYAYINAHRQVCDELNVSFIDIYSHLEHVDKANDWSYWMFDYTHFNKNGDNLVFNIIKSFLFDSVAVSPSKFNPVRQFDVGFDLGFYFKNPMRNVGLKVKQTLLSSLFASSDVQVTGMIGDQIVAEYGGSGVDSYISISAPDGYVFSSVTPFEASSPYHTIVRVESADTFNSIKVVAVNTTNGERVNIINSGERFRVMATEV